MQITVKYNSNSLTREFPEGSTGHAILGDPTVLAAVKAGNNVQLHIGGQTQQESVVLQDGMTVNLYDKACAKAA